jgi:deoxyribonuclease-1-like protein
MTNPFVKNLSALIVIVFGFLTSQAQVKICSWNIQDIGRTKSNEEIRFMANILRDFDVVAIQEVVAKDAGGAQAIARLAEILNNMGSKWEYTISDPTTSSAYKAERYAFLWKASKVKKLGKAWLEKKYHLEIDREPFFATFKMDKKEFTLVNFHAITKSRQPEKEIKYFKLLPAEYPGLNLVFCGDFNCPQSHSVFNPLKAMGYKPVFTNQKTSLRQECFHGDCLASEFDNILYDSSKMGVSTAGAHLFFNLFDNLKEARKISDHVPVWVEIGWK